MSDKILTDEVYKEQSSSGVAKDPWLRDSLGVSYSDVIRTSLQHQPLWPLEYNSHTTLEHLHNQVSNHILLLDV